MERYEKYKDSGIEWLGEIPEHWSKIKVGYCFYLKRGRVLSVFDMEDRGKYPIYSSQTKNNGIMGYIDTYDFDGDYLTWTTDGAYAGTIFKRIGKFNCTNVCGTMKLKDSRVLLDYSYYLLSIASSNYVVHGIQPRLMSDVVSRMPLLIPSMCEQQQIANYLDKKVTAIDQAIDKKQQLVDNIKKAKQKLITQVVTKGLDSNVPMKGSGVDWIGEIPNTYSVCKVKDVADLCSGFSFKSELFGTPDADTYVIKITDIKEKLDFSSILKYAKLRDGRDIVASLVHINDILIAMTGATIGKTMYINELQNAVYLNQRVGAFRLKSPTYSNRLLYYIVSSDIMKSYINLKCNGSAQDNIGKSDLLNFKIVVPTEEEMSKIVNYLDKKVSEFDKLMKLEEESIEKLKKVKQKLITEVVTGKIDVRVMG